MKKNNFAKIEQIINVAKKGGMFILVDDEKRENEGDLVISTSDTNAKNINFKHVSVMIRLTDQTHFVGKIKQQQTTSQERE